MESEEVTQTLREGEGQSHDKGNPVSAAEDQGQGAEVMMSSFWGHRCVAQIWDCQGWLMQASANCH